MKFLDVLKKLSSLGRNKNILILTENRKQVVHTLENVGKIEAIAVKKCYKLGKLTVYTTDKLHMQEDLNGVTVDYLITDYQDFNIDKSLFGNKKVKIFSYKNIKATDKYITKPYKDMFYLQEV
ncbi:hypothetical protein [Cetobacterium sp.]|uniref:hypothetical protein n=1 Tax=Cetobacterium sp. TaxID=2071632 RepID=UPI003F2E9645